MDAVVIETHALRRVFSKPRHLREGGWWQYLFGRTTTIEALRDITWNVASPEQVALIGTNGSGKSTLIKCLCGVIAPSSGDVRVLGLSPTRNRRQLLPQIGVMFGQKSLLFLDVTVRDCLDLYQAVYDIEPQDARTRLLELDDYLAIGHLLDRQVRKLSFGERMRCEIAIALLHRPKVCFLDEPTVGLDVETKHAFIHLLRSAAEEGVATIVATHDSTLVVKSHSVCWHD
ncbi:MAG TPA: ATP-binding cassette domain-containing protein [Bacillota bacterium]